MEIRHPVRHPSRNWSDKDGSLSSPPEADIDQRVQAVLTRLDPDAALVMRVQGRHELDRLADLRQRRIDARESSHAISEAMPVRDVWRGIGRPRTRAQEIEAANRPQPGQWPGRDHMTDDEWEAWQQAAWPDLDEQVPQQRTDEPVQEQTQS